MDLDLHCQQVISAKFPALQKGLIRTLECKGKDVARAMEEGFNVSIFCGCPKCDRFSSYWKRVKSLKDQIEADDSLLQYFSRQNGKA